MLRDKKRFRESVIKDSESHLLFPFLSFEWTGTNLTRFRNFDALVARRNEAVSIGYLDAYADDKVCIIALPHKRKKAATKFRDIAILATAYHATSGTQDHFLSNVAQRFTKEMLQAVGAITPDLVHERLQHEFNVTAAYAPLTTRDVDHSDFPHSELLNLALKDPKFTQDLQSASARRLLHFGVTKSTRIYYVIDTIADIINLSAFAQQAKTRPIRRGIFALLSKSHPISRDALRVARTAYGAMVEHQQPKVREDAIFQLQTSLTRLEHSISSNPTKTIGQLEEIENREVLATLAAVRDTTHATKITLLTPDPFSQKFRNLQQSPDDQAIDLRIDKISSDLVNTAFHDRKTIYVTEERGERDSGEPHYVERSDPPGYSMRSVASELLCDKFRTVLVVPIGIGSIIRAVAIFSSTRRQAFDADISFIQFSCLHISNLVRRVELANDVAWLSQLAFLHGARHTLENIENRLARVDRDLHQLVRSTIKRYSGLQQGPKGKGGQQTVRQLLRKAIMMLPEHARPPQSVPVHVAPMVLKTKVPQDHETAFLEIMDTLLTNAHRHASLDWEHFDFVVHSSSCGTPNVLEVRYANNDARVVGEMLARAFVSPIPGQQGRTYHFGLFLVGVHSRMIGGFSRANLNTRAPLGGHRLEISVFVPLRISDAMEASHDGRA